MTVFFFFCYNKNNENSFFIRGTGVRRCGAPAFVGGIHERVSEMKSAAGIMAILLMTNVCFPYTASEADRAAAAETDSVTVCSLNPAKDLVEEFFMMLDNRQNIGMERALLNNPETCWSLRSDVEALNLWLFKDSDTGAAHLMSESKVTQLTGNAGGLGVTSLAYGDLNRDGACEVYFTYSLDPGQYCAQAGYFDTQTEEVHYFGTYMCPDTELVFTAENGILTVCKAALISIADKVHYELEASAAVAQIVWNNNEIVMEPLSEEMVCLEQTLEPADPVLPEWLPQSTAETKVFMDENSQPVVRDNFVCCSVYISGADSYRANKICAYAAKKSDVKLPISYRKYEDEYYGIYIVACFEMPPDSYLEIYDSSYKNPPLYAYVSDEYGEITEVNMGDINSDGKADQTDLIVIQNRLLTKNDTLALWQTADLNDDCKINAVDLTLLKRMMTVKNQTG